MKRILQLPDSIEKRNGRMSVIMNVYRKIDRSKVQFDFLATDYGKENYYDEIKKLGGRIFLLPFAKLSFKNISLLFDNVINNQHYDYIHYHALSKWGICITRAHRNGIKVIVHSHATQLSDKFSKSLRNRIFCLNILNCADKRVAVSPEAGKKLFMWQDFEYIPNMISYSKFKYNVESRNSIRDKYNISDNDFLIGIVGRISKQKNQKFALKVLKEIITENKNYKLMFVGDYDLREKEYFNALKKDIFRMKLEQNVIFTGMITKIENYYSAFDLLWLPSLYEGMPTVGVEAAANGLQELVSNKVTRKLNIADNIFYLGIHMNNIKEWTNRSLSAHKEHDNGYISKFERSNFNEKRIVAKWMALYGIHK